MKPEIFLEIVKERIGHHVTSSDVRKPTSAEFQSIMSEPCDHNNQIKSLVYDEEGAIYDLRYCAVCNGSLGTV